MRASDFVRRSILTALAILAAAAPTAAVAANIPFTYRKGGIPDLDQRRQSVNGHYGLPNEGRMYCAPASAMNCLAYIANHGYGWMEPLGYRNWQLKDHYDTAGIELFKMGTWFMNTDENTGTTGDNHLKGIRDWFEAWNLQTHFNVHASFASGSFCPSPNDLADAALGGGLVMPIVGWYSLSGGAYTRVGGHVLTMNKLVGRQGGGGAEYTITWRDPGSDDGSFTSQSPFRVESYRLTSVTATFSGSKRTQFQVDGYNSGTNRGFIDGFVVITPRYALTPAPGDFELDLYNLSEIVGGVNRHVSVLGGIHQGAFHSGTSRIAYLTKWDGEFWSDLRVLDPLTAETVLIQNEIQSAMRIAVSRDRRAYVLENFGGRVRGFDLDQIEAPFDTDLPQYMNEIACDDLSDQVYVLGTVNTRLVVYTRDLSNYSDIQLPPELVLHVDSPMCVSPRTGNLWIASRAAAALYELGIAEGVATVLSTISDADLAALTSLTIDDADRAIAGTSNNTALEFARDVNGAWQRVSPSRFDGLPVGSFLAVSTGRSNFDPATMKGPEYANVEPTEFAEPEFDQLGDMNCDGRLTFGDINPFVLALSDPEAYQTKYLECQLENADANQDGSINFADINPFVDLLSGE